MATKMQGAKNRRAVETKEQEVLEADKDLSFDSVSTAVAQTQVAVQQTLASVSAQLTAQLQTLREVEEAILLRSAELKRLHDVEVTAQTLDELEAKIQEQRRSWDEEEAAKKRAFAEQQSERNKKWAREEEEYQYRTSQAHKKLEDSFAALMSDEQKKEREKKELLEKQWAEREAELKKREQELADLRALKEQLPELIKKAENAAAAVAGNSVKKEYETKAQLAAKDHETDKRLAEQEIRSLGETNKKQQAQIDDLKAQLERALGDIKEISTQAVQSASDRRTSDALQRLLEKDSSNKPTK